MTIRSLRAPWDLVVERVVVDAILSGRRAAVVDGYLHASRGQKGGELILMVLASPTWRSRRKEGLKPPRSS